MVRRTYTLEQSQKEQGELEKRKAELKKQLTQRQLTQTQEDRIRSLTKKIGGGIKNLDFSGKQELLRLLVERIIYNEQSIEIQTIIPVGEQLHPLHQGGQRRMGFHIALSFEQSLSYLLE